MNVNVKTCVFMTMFMTNLDFPLQRLDGGLHVLQQVSVMIAFICVYKNSDSSCIRKVHNRLLADGLALGNVLTVLREMAASIGDGQDSSAHGDDGTVGGEEGSKQDRGGVIGGAPVATMAQRQTLIAWCACLAAIENSMASS